MSLTISQRQQNEHAHESFPSFTSLMRCLYVGIGDDPVGSPRTKGFSGVGLKSLILDKCQSKTSVGEEGARTACKCSCQCTLRRRSRCRG